MASDRVTSAVEKILEGIFSGSFTVEKPLPPEKELAEFLDVSRPTMREAVRALSIQGVLGVVHGSGTFVKPMTQWSGIGVIVQAMTRWESPRTLGLKLIEMRRMIEVGACGLAARNRSEADVEQLQQYLELFDRASEAGDVDTVTEVDLAFHDLILMASGNPFLPAVMQPLKTALASSRKHTSSDPKIRERARHHHGDIFAAIRDRDEQAAKDAMRAHMTQTRQDIEAHLSAEEPRQNRN